MTETLFEGWEPVAVPPPPTDPRSGLSADRRRTLRQAEQIAAGIHPLSGGPLHELASRHRDATAPKSDPFTCGSCWFREQFRPGNRVVAKCTFGLTNEHRYVTDGPRISGSVATDVRAWWPACRDYSPSDRLSSDAARYVPADDPAPAGDEDGA
jgi:hypothetical protein